jgi:hypothetical protein
MAVAAVGVLGLTGAGTGVAGLLIGVGAAVVDATVIMPALAGKGRSAALPPRLQGVPVGSNEAGAPRIWSIGGHVRVPTHVLFQKEKVLEPTTTHLKSGTQVNQRQVMVDCLLSLNDRRTIELTQLIGNGKLLIWESRNLVRITTHEMSAAVSGADVVITMSNTLVPSPTDVFAVGDIVKLYGWVSTAGASINGTYWGIKAITGHTSVPGTITLEVAHGQVVAGVAASAGNAFTPGWIERVDDAFVGNPSTTTGYAPIGNPSPTRNLVLRLPAGKLAADIFNHGDIVKVSNVWFDPPPPGGATFQIFDTIQCRVIYLVANEVGVFPVDPAALSNTQWPIGSNGVFGLSFQSATNWPRIEYVIPSVLATPFFPAGFIPKDHYHDGAEDQGEDAILVAEKLTGNVPAYRGVAYQSINEFKVTSFGGQLPFSLEAIIRPDASMTWAQAIYEVMRRAGIPSSAIDVTGVTLNPFLGYFIRGFVATATSIQPLLLAKQIVGQERDGTICLFQIENADVTQIQNGAQFSDLSAHAYGEPRLDDKIAVEDGAEEDLPTFIGVRHQDPDNVYADGYQTFGLRHPTGPTYENRQEIDVSTLVLSRKDAKNLATTTVRRAWVNNRKYQWSLTACYLDQLENDIQTLTDDDGNVITARVIQRDIGSNYLVKCTALREDLTLAVSGSPVQPAAGVPPATFVTSATFISAVLDISSLSDDENNVPMLRFACCAAPGGHWAGGRLFESTDGSDWSPINFLAQQSVMGRLTEPTPSVAGPSETYASSAVTFFTAPVDVAFDHEGDFGIQSCTQAEALNGRNLCAIIDEGTGEVEIAAFTQATLVGLHTYELNGWLRGLRGTTASVRPESSKLVMLWPRNEYPTDTRSYPGLSQTTAMSFKFVPAGRTVEEVDPIQVVATWRNCRPLKLRRLDKAIGPSPYSVRFTTEHWTKEHLPVGQLGPYAMDEPFEGYKFSIYDPSGAGVRRIKWLTATPASGTPTLRDKSVDYTPAEQTADGYTPGAATTFVVDVQQVGFLGQISGLSDSNKRTV